MKNITKTLIFTFSLSIITILVSIFVQLRAISIVDKCSYLDPVIVDILALVAALFLIAEGFYRIYEHKNSRLKTQLTRSIRIAFGFAILTLHVIQFIHK